MPPTMGPVEPWVTAPPSTAPPTPPSRVPLTLRAWQLAALASVEMLITGRAIKPARAMQPRVLRIISSLTLDYVPGGLTHEKVSGCRHSVKTAQLWLNGLRVS